MYVNEKKSNSRSSICFYIQKCTSPWKLNYRSFTKAYRTRGVNKARTEYLAHTNFSVHTYLTFLDEAIAVPLVCFASRQKRMKLKSPYLHHDDPHTCYIFTADDRSAMSKSKESAAKLKAPNTWQTHNAVINVYVHRQSKKRHKDNGYSGFRYGVILYNVVIQKHQLSCFFGDDITKSGERI